MLAALVPDAKKEGTVERTLLMSWIGNSDLDIEQIASGKGPIREMVSQEHQRGTGYSEVWLLDDRPAAGSAAAPRKSEPAGGGVAGTEKREYASVQVFKDSLAGLCGAVTILPSGLTNPVQQFEKAYNLAFGLLKTALDGSFDRVDLGLSSGTWIMQSTLLMASSRFVGPIRHLVSGKAKNGVEELQLPVPLGRLWQDQSEPLVLAAASDQTAKATEAIRKLEFFCQDTAMLDTAGNVLRVAGSRSTVAIYGPTGAGKELFAKLVHAGSQRRGKLVAVNCAAIPANLFEGILFGTAKGAFTGAERTDGKFLEANEGTLFLDEIGELSLDLQSKLLRVVEDRKVTAVGGSVERDWSGRLVIATHRNLLKMVAEGKFREDLYYRLTDFEFTVPALRDRTDLVELALHLLGKVATDSGWQASPRFEAEAVQLLKRHRWPGNVRELRRAMTRAVQFADPKGAAISEATLALAIGNLAVAADVSQPNDTHVLTLSPLPIDWKVERDSLVAAAEDIYVAELAHEKVGAAALQLGITTQGVTDMRQRTAERQKTNSKPGK